MRSTVSSPAGACAPAFCCAMANGCTPNIRITERAAYVRMRVNVGSSMNPPGTSNPKSDLKLAAKSQTPGETRGTNSTLTRDKSLARRPAEITATQQVQVEVKHGLTSSAAVIENCAIARQELALQGKLGRNKLHLAEQILIGRCGVVQRGKVLTRTDQNVSWSLRTDIFESKDVFIFINNLGWNLL